MVVRPVEIVTGLENIGKLFGVGRNTVRIWQKDKGAPLGLCPSSIEQFKFIVCVRK